jgi:hypothetical protein
MLLKNTSHIRFARRADALAGVNLAKRRAWFADGDGQQDGGAAGGQGANGKTPIESLPPDVQDYIKELRGEAKAAREERASIKQQLDSLNAGRQTELQKQGQWETIAKEKEAEAARLKAFEERATNLEKMFRASNEERIKTIPDNKKNLVLPLVDVMPPEKLQEYLNANPDLFVKQPAPDYDAGAGAGGSGGGHAVKLTPEELAMAKRIGVTPEEFMKAKARKQE